MQHFIYHLSPRGTAGFVLANGSLSSKTGGEGDIRRKLVEADLVDCIVAMPDRLFFNTGIPVSLWFISKDRHGNGHRKRKGEVLFIDARKLGKMDDPTTSGTLATPTSPRSPRPTTPGATTMVATTMSPASPKRPLSMRSRSNTSF